MPTQATTRHVTTQGGLAAALLAPAVLFSLIFFAVPLAYLLSSSVLDPTATAKNYVRMATNSEYVYVFWVSFKIAVVSAVFSVAFGYPLAFLISRSAGTRRSVLICLVLMPFWTNILVRCYAWMLILQTKGIVNMTLVEWLEIIPRPINLVYNLPGVIIGMVHYLMPPTVLILDSVLRSIDPKLARAAESLGAKPRQAFWRVTFPLSMPGLRAASMLIFVMGLGFFVTPALLGGRLETTVAMLINQEFTELLNWGFGSALAVTLLVATLLGVLVSNGLRSTPGPKEARR